MRISVNLATRPFVELKPFFLRLRILMGVLAVVAIAALITTHLLQKKLDVAQDQMDRIHAKIVTAQQEKQHNEQRMRQPANAQVLERARFLNRLFLRKSFSWTAVMMDLETVLPSGVQVTSITPEIRADGAVVIRLRVSGERDRAVQLVRNLERSKRFLQPQLTGEAVQAKESAAQGNGFGAANNAAPAGVEFEILANYNPLPEGEKYAIPKAAQDTKSDKAAPAAPGTARRPGQPGPQNKPAAKGYGVVLPPFSTTHPNGVGKGGPQ
jgi:type IV pilus assembly protein PilN